MQIKRKHRVTRESRDWRARFELDQSQDWRAMRAVESSSGRRGTAAVGRRQQVGGVKSCSEGQQMRMTAELEVAACGSGSSSTEHCRWCSGDSCRWCSRLYSVELQVVQQRDFSGAADGAAIFSAILMCAAAWWQWQQQHRALQVVQW